jgi:hypothetical protein
MRKREAHREGLARKLIEEGAFFFGKIDPRNTNEEPPIHYSVMDFPSVFRINKFLKKKNLYSILWWLGACMRSDKILLANFL